MLLLVYIFFVFFPIIPGDFIKNMKPIIEYRTDIDFILRTEEDKQEAIARNVYKKESLLLNPKLICNKKSINIFRDGIHLSLLGKIILHLHNNIFIIENELENFDFNTLEHDNIHFVDSEKLKAKKDFYHTIYELINNEIVIYNEIKGKLSFVMYKALCVSIQILS